MRAGSKKPCPGCGEVHPSRCEAVLKLGRAEIARRQSEEPEVVVVACPHENFAHSLGHLAWIPEELRRTIQKGFIRLVRLLDKGVRDPNAPRSKTEAVKVFKGSDRLQHTGHPYRVDEAIYMERAVAETIGLLYGSLVEALDAARNDGIDAGKSFLARVAEGEMRLTDLNRGLEPKKGAW